MAGEGYITSTMAEEGYIMSTMAEESQQIREPKEVAKFPIALLYMYFYSFSAFQPTYLSPFLL